MKPFMLISALVTSYMCVVQGPCRLQHFVKHGAKRYILNRLRYHDHNHDKAYEIEESPCSTPIGASGSCLSLYDCAPLLSIVNNRNKSPQDIDLLRKSQCGFRGNTPKVCCPSAQQQQQPQDNTCFTPEGKQGRCVNIHTCPHLANLLKPPVSKETINFVQTSRCQGPDTYSVCCGPEPSNNPPVPQNGICSPSSAPPDPRSRCCGVESSTEDKIVGGIATGVDQYPWLALIEYFKSNSIKLLCGGALISGRYVLTAGHCVVGAVLDLGTPRNVRLGEYDTSKDGQDCIPSAGGGSDCTEGITIIPIEKSIPHPDYDPRSNLRRHDIALLRLKQLAPYTDFIRPICLPTSDIEASPPSSFRMFVAGWGAINSTVSKSAIKQHVDVPFRDKQQCQPAYSVPRRNVQLWQGQICAGGEEGKDSCKGDSGGPLMYEVDRHYEVVGIVSFGPTPCGMENIPGVYTKVFEYIPWMRSQIKP